MTILDTRLVRRQDLLERVSTLRENNIPSGYIETAQHVPLRRIVCTSTFQTYKVAASTLFSLSMNMLCLTTLTMLNFSSVMLLNDLRQNRIASSIDSSAVGRRCVRTSA